MVQIELTQEKTETLREVLDSYLSDLRMEITDPDNMDFRKNLKKKKYFRKSFFKIYKKKTYKGFV